MQFLWVKNNNLKRIQPFLQKERKKTAILGIHILTLRVAILSLSLQCLSINTGSLSTIPGRRQQWLSLQGRRSWHPQPCSPGSTHGPGTLLELHVERTTAASRTEATFKMVPAVTFFSFINGKRYGIKESAKNCQERGWGFLQTINKYH